MKNFIGGLFQTRKMAYEARQALHDAGFDDENVKILLLKRRRISSYREGITIQSVAFSALIGAIIGIVITAVLGLLIGQGLIDIPAFMPVSDPFFTLNAVGLFLAQGAVTGAILGAVAQLARGREKPAFTKTGISHGGVILAVNAAESRGDTAREVMNRAGAIDLVNLTEKWDSSVWSQFQELESP